MLEAGWDLKLASACAPVQAECRALGEGAGRGEACAERGVVLAEVNMAGRDDFGDSAWPGGRR